MQRIHQHVAAAFVLLALITGLLMYGYWVTVMEPRLRAEALSQAELLAHAQARPIADAISRTTLSGHPEGLIDTLDQALAFSDPASGAPFIERLALELDYGVVTAPKGSLDLQRGDAHCADCLLVEVPLFEQPGFELLGIARFWVSDRLYRGLSGDVGRNLAGQYLISVALLIALWWVVWLLIQRLQRERRRAERALHQGKEAAEAANRAKSDFLANVSHEIRTPLNAVIGLTALAMKRPMEPALRDYLEKIHGAGDSLLAVINDLLDLSRMEAGGMELERIDFSIDELFQRVAGVVGEEAERKGVALRLSIAPAVPPWLRGDGLRLGQVLLNLAHNAVKFTERGEVLVSAEWLEGGVGDAPRVRFAVRDSGIGIDPRRLPELFRPFSQADGSTTRLYGGTGLGLAICKQLVELMGGTIGAESSPGEGSRFHFTVPLGRAEHHEQGLMPPTVAPGAPVSELPVLLVEDNAINQQIALELLERIGLETVLAENGVEALERLHERRFALVLMDIQMPEMDGFEATRRLRREEALRDLPVVAMTAHAMSGDEQRCLDRGMDDYLSKPVTEERLVEVLGRWLPRGEDAASPAAPGGADRPDRLDRGGAPELPGIDGERALALSSGNRQLVGRVIRQFLIANRETLPRIRGSLTAGGVEEAKAMIHTLKGEAANIAAVELAEAAAALERAVNEGVAWEAPLARLGERLGEVLEGIDRWPGPAPEVVEEEGEPVELLKQLNDYLAENNTRAVACLQRLRASLAGEVALAETLEALNGAVERLAFAEARESLPRIARHLGVEIDERE